MKVESEFFFGFDTARCSHLEAESPSSARKVSFKGKCSIGSFSYVGQGSVFTNTDIGRYCSIAANVTVGPTPHPTDRFTTHLIAFGSTGPFQNSSEFRDVVQARPTRKGERTRIGNDVWIGINVTIMRGVVIGDGAIIGAGSVVTKDVPPHDIVGGVPAKHIRSRFEPEMSKRLIAASWWNYDLSVPEVQEIDFSDTIAFIEVFEKLKARQLLRPLAPASRVFRASGAANAEPATEDNAV
jgi:virginiamycin A acetyltransferase